MIDKIKIKIPLQEIKESVLYNLLQQEKYLSVGKMKMYRHNENAVIVGSLPKYLYNENLTNLTFNEIETAFRKLENELSIKLDNAEIESIEIGANIPMLYNISLYLDMFGDCYRKNMIAIRNIYNHELESITYGTKRNNETLIFYNKIKEASLKKNKNIKHELTVLKTKGIFNLLRVEYRVKKLSEILPAVKVKDIFFILLELKTRLKDVIKDISIYPSRMGDSNYGAFLNRKTKVNDLYKYFTYLYFTEHQIFSVSLIDNAITKGYLSKRDKMRFFTGIKEKFTHSLDIAENELKHIDGKEFIKELIIKINNYMSLDLN